MFLVFRFYKSVAAKVSLLDISAKNLSIFGRITILVLLFLARLSLVSLSVKGW